MKTKIVIIGAGSASFGPAILGDILQCQALTGSAIALCDLNAQGLELIARLAERANREWGAGMIIEAATDRKQVLPDAEFVITSIAVEREKLWRQDWEIPAKYGMRQPLGENGGPGAVFHTARNAPMILDICRDMEKLCPDAWLLNFTNPVPRMTLVARRHSKVKAVGLCHQIGMGYAIVAYTLAKELGIERPASGEWGLYGLGRQAHELLDIKAAGLNHFTFMLDIRNKKTGEDLYPLFKQRLAELPPDFQPLTRRIYDAFGVCPATGDGHLAEYTHWTHDPQTKPWEKYGIHLYDWDKAERGRDKMWQEIEAIANGAPIPKLGSGERAIPIIEAILYNRNQYELAVDIPNEGYIANLPDGAIVEVPGVVSRFGVHGLGVGCLPEPVAALCRTQLTVASLAVDAGVLGSKELMLQALLVDPMVNDIDQAKALMAEMLEVQAQYLPQFHG
ncbi:MAG: family 4 glycosyl hydrolase [Anaerolineae bacterium]